MKQKEIFITLLLFFSMHVIGMDSSINNTPLLIDVWSVVFDCADIMEKRSLALASRLIYKRKWNEYLKNIGNLGTEEFINNLYAALQAKDNKFFSWVVKRCNFYTKRALFYYDQVCYLGCKRDDMFQYPQPYGDLDGQVKIVVQRNDKRHVNFFMPAFGIFQFLDVFKEYTEQEIMFTQIVNKCSDMQKIGKDIRDLFEGNKTNSSHSLHACYQIIENADEKQRKEYIEKALRGKNFSALVFLLSDLFCKDDSLEKKEEYFLSLREKPVHQKLLEQAHYVDLYQLVERAIEKRYVEKTLSIAKMISQRRSVSKACLGGSKNFLSNIFTNDFSEVLLELIKSGFILDLVGGSAMTSDQIKKVVEIGDKALGKEFWSKKYYYYELLHEAVKNNDIKRVKYLLFVGASPKALDHLDRPPILYSFNNSDMYDLFINIKKENNFDISDKCYESIAGYNDWKIRIIDYVVVNCAQKNLIELIEGGFFRGHRDLLVCSGAKNNKINLLKYLLHKMGTALPDECKKYLWGCAAAWQSNDFIRLLLDNEITISYDGIKEYFFDFVTAETIIALLKAGFKISKMNTSKELCSVWVNAADKDSLLPCFDNMDVEDMTIFCNCAFEQGKIDMIRHLGVLRIIAKGQAEKASLADPIFEDIDEDLVVNYLKNRRGISNESRRSLLPLAICAKKWNVVTCLLSLGVDTITKCKESYLGRIIKNISEKTVAEHLEKDSAAIADLGKDLYRYAVREKRWGVVKCLLLRGIDITAQEHNSYFNSVLENIDEDTMIEYVNQHQKIISNFGKLFLCAIDKKKWKFVTQLLLLDCDIMTACSDSQREQLITYIDKIIIVEYLKRKNVVFTDKDKHLLHCAINGGVNGWTLFWRALNPIYLFVSFVSEIFSWLGFA